jgi:hypothetical protein
MVDPNNSAKNVAHFMLLKPAVIQIAEEASEGLMEFSLYTIYKCDFVIDA